MEMSLRYYTNIIYWPLHRVSYKIFLSYGENGDLYILCIIFVLWRYIKYISLHKFSLGGGSQGTATPLCMKPYFTNPSTFKELEQTLVC